MEILLAITGLLWLLVGVSKLFGLWFARNFPGLAELTREETKQ